MMTDNCVKFDKTDILAMIVEKMGGTMRTDSGGLYFSHHSGTSRWVEMDGRTCALIVDLTPTVELSFDLVERTPKSCFHSIYLLSGNIELSGADLNGSLNLVSNEVVHFRSSSQRLNFIVPNNTPCRAIVLSHSLRRQYLSENQDKLDYAFRFGSCKGIQLTSLKRIFYLNGKKKSHFILKGEIFSLFGNTLPTSFCEPIGVVPRPNAEIKMASNKWLDVKTYRSSKKQIKVL